MVQQSCTLVEELWMPLPQPLLWLVLHRVKLLEWAHMGMEALSGRAKVLQVLGVCCMVGASPRQTAWFLWLGPEILQQQLLLVQP